MSSSSKPSTNCVFVDVSTKIVGEENYPNYCLLQTCKMFHAIQTTPELAKWSEHCMSVAPWVAHYQFVAIADSTVCILIPNSYITPYPCCHTWSNHTYTYQMFLSPAVHMQIVLLKWYSSNTNLCVYISSRCNSWSHCWSSTQCDTCGGVCWNNNNVEVQIINSLLCIYSISISVIQLHFTTQTKTEKNAVSSW